MVLTFCKKNEDFYERYSKEDSFIHPFDTDVIAQYHSIDVLDRPIMGDIVKVNGDMYKVFQTMVDYSKKEIFVVVESFNERNKGMRLENNLYTLYKKENDEVLFLTVDYQFSSDIRQAIKIVGCKTALAVVDDYKEQKFFNKEISDEDYENEDFNFGLKLTPLKITYEW